MTKTCSGYAQVERDGVEIDVCVSVEWVRIQETVFPDPYWEVASVSAETTPPQEPGPIELTRAEEIEFEDKFRP